MLKRTNKYILFLTIIAVGILGIFPYNFGKREEAIAELILTQNQGKFAALPVITETSLLALSSPTQSDTGYTPKVIKVIVTAYSSSIYETDGDPFITASGQHVRDGIVANNLLPFGTRIKLPDIFGNKIFVVEDRLNAKKGYYHVDIWFPSRESALKFGSKITKMEILSPVSL